MSRIAFSRLLLVLLVCIGLTGCLTTEYKEYRFTLNSDGTGSGSIKFVNIVSEEDEEKDVSFTDFGELISDYLEGTQFEDDNPDYNVTSKEIFVENNQLCALVKFTFASYAAPKLYRYEKCDCAPLMYYTDQLSETIVESNGENLNDTDGIPLIIWQPDSREIYYKSQVKEDMSDAHSLVDLYTMWKDKQ